MSSCLKRTPKQMRCAKALAALFPWDHLIWKQYASTLLLSGPWGRVHCKGMKAAPGTEAGADGYGGLSEAQ